MFGGNVSKPRQFETAFGLLAVSSATGPLPPRALITWSVVSRISRSMTPVITNFLELQAPNSFDTKEFENGASSLTMSSPETGGRFAPTAIRMRAVRRASAYPSRKDFADFLGITIPRLSNIENGFPISRDVQNRVSAKLPWVSMDWLLYGSEGNLTTATVQRLTPLVVEESDTTLPRSRSRGAAAR